MKKVINIGILIGWLGVVFSSGPIIVLGLACVTVGTLSK